MILSVPNVLANPTIVYARRLVALAGKPVRFTATQYNPLGALWLHAGWVIPYDGLLGRAEDVNHSRTSSNSLPSDAVAAQAWRGGRES